MTIEEKKIALYKYVSFDCVCDYAIFVKCAGWGDKTKGHRKIKQALRQYEKESDIKKFADKYIKTIKAILKGA